ncbi:hypothetical protein AB0I28_34895 [Phytomonospora sp. NPDC050363]|uniref:hypothetical protein n=1 Tax=Phytomonospora sp. NPDC050363 TaxID=3155642 RepID=UPI0033FC02AD
MRRILRTPPTREVAMAGRKPMFTAAGHLDAPLATVAETILRVRPGPAQGDNLVLLQAQGVGGGPVSGGPDHFTLEYAGGRLTVEVDRERRTLSAQGGWWYRGEYTVTAAEDGGTVLTLRVYNVAGRGSRWAVPLANNFFRGHGDRTRAALAGQLSALGERLDCATRPLDEAPEP